MSYDTQHMRVDEIRSELVNKFGMAISDVEKIKGKANLVKLLSEAEKKASADDDGMLDLVDFDTDISESDMDYEPLPEEEEAPDIASPEWTDYVLGLLTNKEKIGENPTTDGLRRLTEKLLGDITEINVQIAQVPKKEDDMRATVRVTVIVDCFDDKVRRADGVADCYWGNTDKPYRNFPTATAETRAEGRALKRLLKLRRVHTAEEGADKVEDDITGETAGKITEHQIRHLEIMCRDKVDVNVKKFVDKQRPDTNNIREISYSEILEMFTILSAYQSAGTPDDVRGFDSDWRNELGA